MYRTKIKELIKWKLNHNRKPLVFLGARQVGKTWLVQEFGKTEYRQMVYVNFEDKDAPKNIFQDFNIDRIITLLNAYSGLKITAEDSLLVFDEIQAAPLGITSLKYFYEKAPHYQIIAAGSLLGVNLHPDESFPVGKVEFLTLYPLSYTEFLLAMGETGIVELIEKREWELLDSFHSKLVNYLRSGTNLKARSFKLFCKKFQPPIAIRTSLTNYREESWMTNVPLYIVGDYFSPC